MCDRIDLLKRINELEEENVRLKEDTDINKEINLLYFLRDMIPNCRIYGGIEVGYIIVDNYKEHRGLGSIISCPYTYKVIREKGVNSMEPLKIIEEFYERGWVDVD